MRLRCGTAFRLLAFMPLALLSNCQSSRPEPSALAQKWADALESYDIDPVFPPRDVNVGDVFLVLEPPPGSKDPDDNYAYASRSLKITQIDVRARLSADYRNSMQLPATSSANPTADIFTSPDKITNLPAAAYLGFSFVNVADDSLANFMPVRALGEILGIMSRNEPVMSISIPQAEDVELPALDAYDAWASFCGSAQSEGICYSNSQRFQFLKDQITEATDRPDLVPRLFFVTHVYYASSIKYSYSASDRYGVAIAGPSAPTASSSSGSKGSAPPAATATINMTAPAGGAAVDAQSLQAMQTKLGNLEKQVSTLSGAGTTTTTVTPTSASLTQAFRTPVAIGYRGLWITPSKAAYLPPGE